MGKRRADAASLDVDTQVAVKALARELRRVLELAMGRGEEAYQDLVVSGLDYLHSPAIATLLADEEEIDEGRPFPEELS